MHPVLFRLPWADWPVRMFGLFVIAAFLITTLWAQWRYTITVNPAFREDAKLRKAMSFMVPACLLSRVLFIAIPISWSVTMVAVWAADILIWVVVWRAWSKAIKRHGNEGTDFLTNLGLWLLLVGFFGSRVFWVITTESGRSAFVDSPLRALFFIWDGGIVWYGGLLFAAAYGAWYLWVKKQNILGIGDIVLVGVSLALFIGRFACLSAGDDYGRPTDVPWGIVFPRDPDSMMLKKWVGMAVHPTQLYMALNGLVLFAVGAFVLNRKRFDGQVLYLSLILYAVGRSIIELYRGDETRGLYEVGDGLLLSSSQIISIPVFVVAGILYLRGWLRSRRAGSSSPATGNADSG